MERSAPYQPRLGWWGHAWRTSAILGTSLGIWSQVVRRQTQHPELLVLDLVCAVICFVVIFWRRRFPVTVAVLTTALSAVSALSTGPALLAAVSLATRRRWMEIVPIGVLAMVAGQVLEIVQPPQTDEPLWLTLSFNVIFTAAVLAWGMYIGSRRELMWTLRQRAERAESEQELRVGQARSTERAKIAREMHDVLAHRISQISLHAGALSFRDDLTHEDMRASATVIQEKAHEALTDLRGVLGVLRDESGDLTHAPQPTYADIAPLIAEATESGLRVRYRDTLRAGVEVPDGVGRTVYRIVQEGITNVRKHAPGSALTLELSGSPEQGVDIVMSNPLGFAATDTPGSGLGLIGLVERAELRGGRLEHGQEGSTFVVRGWIPWAA